MKFSPTTKIIAALVLLLLPFIVVSCNEQEVDVPKKEYLPQVSVLEIKPGLEQEILVTGEIFAEQISRMTSEVRGKVSQILVAVGDTVSRDQELIQLNSSEVLSSFSTASSTLQNARVSLDQTKLSTQNSIDAAKISLSTAQSNLKNTLKQNKTLKDQAEEALNAAEVNLDLSVNNAEVSLSNMIKSALPTAQTAFNAVNKIMGVTDAYRFIEDDFRRNLGALDSREKLKAENLLEDLDDQIDSYIESYDNAVSLLEATEEGLQMTLSVLNNSVSGNNYTQTQLITDINSVTAQLSPVRAASSALLLANSALNSAKQSTNGGSQTLLNAEAAYNATINQLDNNGESARNAVESAKNALEIAKRSAELSEIGAKSSVDSAYGTYDQARIGKNKLSITAPFAGKISEIHVKNGEEINPGTLLITVEDDSVLKLIAYLSSRDVKKIAVGDLVMIDKNDLSEITSIAPSADPITKKYKVEIAHQSESLKAGELIRLTFMTGNGPESDRLFIPLPALHILPDELFVWMLEGNKTVKSPVVAGEILGDFVEITSGLNVGDEIIYEGGRLIEEEGIKVDILNRPSPKIPINNGSQ